MSRRSDNITITSPAGSSNAPAVREVVRVVTSVMPDPTAFNRGDEWTQSDAGDPVDWHLYIHNGTTWVEKYTNPEGKLSPTGLGNQTKTVASTLDSVPDYIGQPGIDADGNSYISIALSGTMWLPLNKEATPTAKGLMSATIASNFNSDGSFIKQITRNTADATETNKYISQILDKSGNIIFAIDRLNKKIIIGDGYEFQYLTAVDPTRIIMQ